MYPLNFWLAAGAVASQAAAQAHHSYTESLGICRFWHGGPIDRKLPATHADIAGCLGRLGWSPDGLPVNLLRDME